MGGNTVTELISARELREDWRRKLAVEQNPDVQVEVTLRVVKDTVRERAQSGGLLGARERLGLERIDPEERDQALKSERTVWDD